jgi:predicted transcriptional regulator
MNVILSIRPKFCQSIFEGKKVYEYRKQIFTRKDVDKVYVYATKPICRIVGFFTIDEVIEDSPNNMWKMTHEGSGITKEYFDAYFSGCDMAHAISIGEVVKFDTPIDPKKVIKNFTAPQNYRYVDYDI